MILLIGMMLFVLFIVNACCDALIAYYITDTRKQFRYSITPLIPLFPRCVFKSKFVYNGYENEKREFHKKQHFYGNITHIQHDIRSPIETESKCACDDIDDETSI